MKLNPFLFFFFKDGALVLWDYKNHNQFQVDVRHFERLRDFSSNPVFQSDNPMDQLFLSEGIFVEEKETEQWGWDVLSQIFHVGTKDVSSVDIFNNHSAILQYVELCEAHSDFIPDINTTKNGEIYDLPTADLSCFDKKSLLSVLQERMTSRHFEPVSLTLQEVSNLLYMVFGQIHGSWKALEDLGLERLSIRKSSPAAGGLHASEAYILATNIEGLPKGIYHYRSHEHVLSLISSEWDETQLEEMLCGQPFGENLPLGLVITSRFDKLWHKYPHSRGYRVSLVDVGHLSQTFQLCVTAMGLESWLTGMFQDTMINQLLKIDNTSEQALFFIGAGRGVRQFLDNKTLAFLKTAREEKE